MKKRIAVLALLLLTAGCGPEYLRWQPAEYRVQAGDTLYSIAWRYGLDYRELAEWNGVGSDYLIYPGQTLRLSPPRGGAPPRPGSRGTPSGPEHAAASPPEREVIRLPAAGVQDWRWPANGPLIAGYRDPNATGKGIDIGGSEGDPVMAAAAGRVVYSGSGLIGYGKLIIIKHTEQFLSAYGHNSELYVQEGDEVQAGDRIAALGIGPGQKPMLHFEIRRNGESVDPMNYLPAR